MFVPYSLTYIYGYGPFWIPQTPFAKTEPGCPRDGAQPICTKAEISLLWIQRSQPHSLPTIACGSQTLQKDHGNSANQDFHILSLPLPPLRAPRPDMARRSSWEDWARLIRSDNRNIYAGTRFEARQRLLDIVQLEMPLFFVNREARKIALAWIRANNIKMRAGTKRQPLVFVHAFSPMRDVLYITPDTRDEFLSNPDNRMFEGDLLAKFTYIQFEVTRAAITESLLRSAATAAFASILVTAVLHSFFPS